MYLKIVLVFVMNNFDLFIVKNIDYLFSIYNFIFFLNRKLFIFD